MTRFRRPKTTIGRTQYQLRMPFPTVLTPENTMANFREILRWANELPHANDDSFVPYFFEYNPIESADEWDVDLVAKLQTEFDTDLMPTGTWLVHARVTADGTDYPADAVGAQVEIEVKEQNGPGKDTNTVGYMDGAAIRVVADVEADFTAETLDVTYEWFLPPVSGGLMGVNLSVFSLVHIAAASDELRIEALARAATIDDPTVGPDLIATEVKSFLYVWALRLTDGYNIPTTLEDVTPP